MSRQLCDGGWHTGRAMWDVGGTSVRVRRRRSRGPAGPGVVRGAARRAPCTVARGTRALCLSLLALRSRDASEQTVICGGLTRFEQLRATRRTLDVLNPLEP